MKKIKIGVTGSKGFIGSHLLKALKERKNFSIDSFDKPKRDLLVNFKSLKNFVKNKDIIFHLAGANRGTEIEIIAGNVIGSYNLAQAIRETKSKAKIVFLSSIHAKGESVYGLSKESAERIFFELSKENNNQIVVFRLTNVFGEGARPFYNSVVATFCYQIAHSEKPKIIEDRKLPLLYVKDLVKILTREIEKKRKKNFFLKGISSPDKISVSQLLKLISGFREIKSEKELKTKFERDLYRTYLSYLNYDYERAN